MSPGLDAIERWFSAKGWEPFAFQRETWAHYRAGKSGMIHAATGTGKTFAAWLGLVSEGIEDATAPSGIRALWITPLRALAADTEDSLLRPIRELELPWTLERRTGDSSQSVRARQRERLPTALVTTPESLSLMLSREDSAERFRDLRLVVVDEWHELIASKRGVLTELCLARIRGWCPEARTWGLSATIGNLDVAMQCLLGTSPGGVLVRGVVPKEVRIDSIHPPGLESFPWGGHLGIHQLPSVVEEIERSGTTLVFTNTRSQAEIWFQAILESRPEWQSSIALHHGSLDRDERERVEDGLAEGRLRAVVCTSSLDLGVDFTPVERVLQIGSPKGVARLLQRAGRSGHRPGVPSRVTCVPTHALELVEIAAARDFARLGRIESRPPIDRPLDVLSQHLVTVALGGGFESEAMYREVTSTYSYRQLSRAEWGWVLDFIVRGGNTLEAYPEFHRVEERDGRYEVVKAEVARRHRMSVGTISSDPALGLRHVIGESLGTIEESFLARLAPGQSFVFGGRVLALVRIKDMTAFVRNGSGRGAVPRWMGGRVPLSSELSAGVRLKLEQARAGVFDSPEMEAVAPILRTQQEQSAIPGTDELLVERFEAHGAHHLYVFPFEGRLVHEGLAALLSSRIGAIRPLSFTYAISDYGFELRSDQPIPFEEALAAGLFSPERVAEDIVRSLNASELARRQFRDIARVAGLVFSGYPGAPKTARQTQASAGLLFDVFNTHDPDHLLVQQARREVLESQLEVERLRVALDRLSKARMVLKDLEAPGPLSAPLFAEGLREQVGTESLDDRVRRMSLIRQEDETDKKKRRRPASRRRQGKR